MKLFLCGDVMTGRGIDQILARPSDPAIHECYARSALEYVRLAEAVNGPIPRGVDDAYIWGDALRVLDSEDPQARVANLETAVTRSDAWARKAVDYRMNPANVACLTAARLDCCVLANNHVHDWGMAGLLETLKTLNGAGLRTAGAGTSAAAAEAPAIVPVGDGRLLVFALGAPSSGIPPDWAARTDGAGIAFLPDLAPRRVDEIASRVLAWKQPGDVVVLSVHWGANWGYTVHRDELDFAHALIERANVDLVHGHSSHHPRGIDVYRGKLILWGCGDFINDYEGIAGYEEFRSDLGVMYFPTLDAASGRLLKLELIATQMKRFQVRLASAADARWLCAVIGRESRSWGVSTELRRAGRIALHWKE